MARTISLAEAPDIGTKSIEIFPGRLTIHYDVRREEMVFTIYGPHVHLLYRNHIF